MERSDKEMKSGSGRGRNLFKISLLTAAILMAGLLFKSWQIFFAVNSIENSGYLYIHEGTTFESLIDSLVNHAVVKNIKSFRIAAKFENPENIIKPGRYKIKTGMNNRQIVRMFKLGLQTPLNLTLSGNIQTMERLAAIISLKISSDSAAVLKFLKSKELIDSLGFNNYTFPGMFIQNTYEIYWTTKPLDIIKRFKKEYDNFWNESRREKAKAIGLTPTEVTSLASIVAMEGNIKSEHPVIAGVYINRIKKGIPLQADPTIKFALNDPSIKRILFKHLEIDSPYNTYKFRGLPPGPIALPSPSVIDSVLNYTRHNYLYFCAKPTLDGSHSFAGTLKEHGVNARAYQKAIKGLR